VAVFVLALGTVVLAGLVTAVESSSSPNQSHGEVWYLVAPNPFVILADAAPTAPVIRKCYSVNNGQLQNGLSQGGSTFCQTSVQTGDVLGGIRMSIRGLESTNSLGDGQQSGGAIWPYGLSFDLLVAIGLLWAAVRSLATPKKRLPKGVRLA
jgi:hypothetical protein